MSVARIAISLDPKLAKELKRAARKVGTSAWIAEAVRRRLQSEGLRRVIEDWEREHGVITEADMEAVRRRERGGRRR